MYGVIDIGSNTIRLSVYKKTDTTIRPMLHKKNMAGLAGYVTKEGNLSEKGLNKAIRVLSLYRQILDNIDVRDVFVFATASLRNIGNTNETLTAIEDSTGFKIDLVSGEQEALYDHIAVTKFMDMHEGMLVDIGGGSTELVFYQGGKVNTAISMPIGSLSLYSNYVSDILPTKKEIEKIEKAIKKELKKVDYEGECPAVCGIGGTVRGARKLHNEFKELNSSNRNIDIQSLQIMLNTLIEDRSVAIEKIIKTSPDRIHTIIPGLMILNAVCKKYDIQSVSVAEYGVREGYLYSKLFLEER